MKAAASGVLGRLPPCDVEAIKRDYGWGLSVRQDYLKRRTGHTKCGVYLLSRHASCGLAGRPL